MEYTCPMQKELMLSIPEEIYRQIERVATETQRNVAAVALDTISLAFPLYPAHPDRAQMKKEIAAYHSLHSELRESHLGHFVAIYQGQLVDSDTDPIALHQRISTRYPGKVVLSRKVQVEAEPVLYMRSPRLERIE